mgnify:CR=1 FL=1
MVCHGVAKNAKQMEEEQALSNNLSIHARGI